MALPLRAGILAGEMSGDILGAGLMQALKQNYPDMEFTGIGGAHMTAEGLESMVPMDRLSVMGLVEPLKRLPELLSIRRRLRQQLMANPPQVFIGIDSPDFNLGLEASLKASGIPVVHYVSPSVWAWRSRRIHKIGKAVDLMLTLFPFEQSIYHDNGIAVQCVGHTLADEMPVIPDVSAARARLNIPIDARVLALLPGSRQGEVERLGPVFFEAASKYRRKYPGLKVLLPAANPDRQTQLKEMLKAFPDLDIDIINGRAREVMTAADQILIASGTATLEAMLCKKPMVVCYRMAPLSHAIISRMLKVPYFSLPNLLAGKPLVPELLQDQVNPERLFTLLDAQHQAQHDSLVSSFTDIHLAIRKNANQAAARAVLSLIGMSPSGKSK